MYSPENVAAQSNFCWPGPNQNIKPLNYPLRQPLCQPSPAEQTVCMALGQVVIAEVVQIPEKPVAPEPTLNMVSSTSEKEVRNKEFRLS